jgi:hypothetical protein
MADLAQQADGTTKQVETPEPENESLSANASSFIPSEGSFISSVEYQSVKSFVIDKGKLNPFFCLTLCTCEVQAGPRTPCTWEPIANSRSLVYVTCRESTPRAFRITTS